MDARRTVEAVWRIESPRLVARLTRLVGDVGRAEDLAQDALAAALERWPSGGVPPNPGAWLMATARNRAIDQLRREARHPSAELPDLPAPAEDPDEDVGDDLLRLMLVACHPVVPPEGRVALVLRTLGGLTTREIARSFLVSEATVAQRIVRAKRTLSEARVPFELPPRSELGDRLESVLDVIYLVFNEGYAPTAGDQWVRQPLCDEALRLARVLATLAPGEPEVHGLVALLEIQASRAAARVGPGGEPVLLADQDRSRWDRLLVRRGLAALDRAAAAGPLGRFGVQAAIAACHARAPSVAATDWGAIVVLYEALLGLAPSPVVALNRAVAVSMAEGPEAALPLVDALEEPLADYHLLHAVRADLLARLGRTDEARASWIRAGERTENARERALLLARAGSA